jgi:hypothetical protein
VEPGPALGVCIGDKHSVEIVIHDVESDVRTEMGRQSSTGLLPEEFEPAAKEMRDSG